MRYIFTGRASAQKETPGPHTTCRPCISVENSAKRVEPEMIAWAAVVVRPDLFNITRNNPPSQVWFVLSSQKAWKATIGTFSLERFWETIVRLFRGQNEKWANDTLRWWNL